MSRLRGGGYIRTVAADCVREGDAEMEACAIEYRNYGVWGWRGGMEMRVYEESKRGGDEIVSGDNWRRGFGVDRYQIMIVMSLCWAKEMGKHEKG